jgi:hypothetical protein
MTSTAFLYFLLEHIHTYHENCARLQKMLGQGNPIRQLTTISSATDSFIKGLMLTSFIAFRQYQQYALQGLFFPSYCNIDL